MQVMRLAVVAVTALALAAASCGGVESEPNLANAAERMKAAGSFRYEHATDIPGWSRGPSRCEGEVDTARKRARGLCRDSLGIDEVRAIEGRLYGNGGETEGKWREFLGVNWSFDEFGRGGFLWALRKTAQTIERVGAEDVRGEPTVRYTLTVDCVEEDELLVCEGPTAVVDVWIGDDGLVRRIRLPAGDARFFDYGAPLDVAAPPPELIEDHDDISSGPCDPQTAGPIGVDQALEALRAHGFDVRRSPGPLGSEDRCGDRTASHLVSERHGPYLWCAVHKGGGPALWLTLRPVAPVGWSSPPVERSLENLSCLLFAQGPSAEERVEALDAALDELKRELGP
jgi:hypothetical protein